MIDDQELQRRSQALHEAQEVWEDLTYNATPKMPCPECGGRGEVYGGSLGGLCPRCGGARVVDVAGAEPPLVPPFAALRAAISAYGDWLADRALPEAHPGRRGLLPPPPESVPTMATLEGLRQTGLRRAQTLRSTGIMPGAPHLELEAAGAPSDDLGAVTDAELDDLEPGGR